MANKFHEEFKKKYGLKNKEGIVNYLLNNGKIVGYSHARNQEYWILPDKTSVTLDAKKRTVEWFGEEYNSRILKDVRSEFFERGAERMRDNICPVCDSSNVRRVEDDYRCEDCAYSETPIGWNHPDSVRRYRERLRERRLY